MPKPEFNGQADGQHSDSRYSTEAVVGVSVGITTAILVWVLRGGALLASLFSVSPLWRQFDPLPVVDSKSKTATAAQNDDQNIDRMFDQSQTPHDRRRFRQPPN